MRILPQAAPNQPSIAAADLAALHEPYADLLHAALVASSPSAAQCMLDLACGPGLKSDWLATRGVSGGRLVGIDHDAAAMQQAQGMLPQHTWLAGAAQALPLRDECIDLCWCVAALRLFAQPAHALREVHRVLCPGGVAVFTVVAQRWVRVRQWPAALVALVDHTTVLHPADGLGADLHRELAHAGVAVAIRALLLDPLLSATAAELALADWQALRPIVASQLPAAVLAQCDAVAAADVEPEPLPVLLVARVTKT